MQARLNCRKYGSYKTSTSFNKLFVRLKGRLNWFYIYFVLHRWNLLLHLSFYALVPIFGIFHVISQCYTQVIHASVVEGEYTMHFALREQGIIASLGNTCNAPSMWFRLFLINGTLRQPVSRHTFLTLYNLNTLPNWLLIQKNFILLPSVIIPGVVFIIWILDRCLVWMVKKFATFIEIGRLREFI